MNRDRFSAATRQRAPEVIRLGSIDLRGAVARIEHDEGDLIFVIGDEDREVDLTSGLGGSFDEAVQGAERIADVAYKFAAALRLNPLYVGRTPSGTAEQDSQP